MLEEAESLAFSIELYRWSSPGSSVLMDEAPALALNPIATSRSKR